MCVCVCARACVCVCVLAPPEADAEVAVVTEDAQSQGIRAAAENTSVWNSYRATFSSISSGKKKVKTSGNDQVKI